MTAGETKTISDPTRNGYTFKGWLRSGTGSSFNTSTKVFTMGSANATLTATWTAINYTLTVNPNGGTWSGSASSQNFTMTVGQTRTIADPTRNGYTFNGWSRSGNGSSFNTSTKVFTMGYENATLTATWTANTITVNLNNMSATTPGTSAFYYKYGTSTYYSKTT